MIAKEISKKCGELAQFTGPIGRASFDWMFVYHIVPESMIGETLMPLNQLKSFHPELYAQNLKRYEGRESLLKEVIPYLKCLWNDVLHFSPVDLRLVKKALLETGHAPRAGLRYFKIPIESLGGLRASWFLYYPMQKPNDWSLQESEFRDFAPSNYTELSEVPAATKTYYSAMATQGKRPLLFYECPHVLVHGKVSVKGCEVLSWD